jgi:dTDP-4-amino-4,6-dideoxygalactose transaminase
LPLRHDFPSSLTLTPRSTFNFQLSSTSPLPGADRIMNHTIFLGTYPGLTNKQIDYMAMVIRDFVAGKAEIGKADS